jgi:hypothetical protein
MVLDAANDAHGLNRIEAHPRVVTILTRRALAVPRLESIAWLRSKNSGPDFLGLQALVLSRLCIVCFSSSVSGATWSEGTGAPVSFSGKNPKVADFFQLSQKNIGEW